MEKVSAQELRIGNLITKDGIALPVASINSDETLRLKCDDEKHPNYSHGTIGCFHLNSCAPIELKFVHQLQNLFSPSQGRI